MQIIRLYDYFYMKDNYLCLVFEKLETSLRDLMKTKYLNKGFSLERVKSISQQLVYSLSYIHSFNLMHLDCKLFY